MEWMSCCPPPHSPTAMPTRRPWSLWSLWSLWSRFGWPLARSRRRLASTPLTQRPAANVTSLMCTPRAEAATYLIVVRVVASWQGCHQPSIVKQHRALAACRTASHHRLQAHSYLQLRPCSLASPPSARSPFLRVLSSIPVTTTLQLHRTPPSAHQVESPSNPPSP